MKRQKLEEMATPFITTAAHQSMRAIRNARISSSINEGTKYIGTHNGTFHCDEALAVSLLKILPQFEHHEILRTRDTDLLKTCDVIVDVGGEYNPETNRFDHHQSTFDGTFEDRNIKLSSAGLVYKHYGKDIIKQVCQDKLEDSIVDIMFKKVYSGFVEHIDAIDNGVEIQTGGTLNYNISTSLSSRVGCLNPRWNEDSSVEMVNNRFHQAMLMTSIEFVERILYLHEGWFPARSIVERNLEKRFNVHSSGEIFSLDQYCPWKSHLSDLEEENVVPKGQIKFVLYEDQTGSMWRVQGVNSEEGSFSLRKALSKSWRGLRGEELEQISGLHGIKFVHAAGFIGGHSTYEGALQMAIKSLEEKDEE